MPGNYLRIRLPIGAEHQALLIIDRAIQSDQGHKFVYVVDTDNKVQRRNITTKALQANGRREVEGEIKPDDWVVVGAIQQVREKMDVKPDRQPMPSYGGQADAASPTASGAKGTANK